MRSRTLALAGLALLLAAGAPTPARSESKGGAWLHVRVDEGARQSKVTVNLPVSIVDIALQAAPEDVVSNGRIHLGREWRHGHGRAHDLSVSDLRRAWAEMKATGDAEFATVEDDDQKVRVARAGGLMLVHVDRPDGKESVRVEVPIEVVDALFSGEGEELNLKAALGELQKRRGDIVRVRDDHSTVRIWIDEGN